MLGPFKAETDSGVDVTPRSRKARAILAILALSQSSGMSRNRLAGLLWDRVDPEQGRNLLRGAIHELRAIFDRAGLDVVRATRDHVSLRSDRIWTDLENSFRRDEDGERLVEAGIDELPLLDDLENLGRNFDAWLSTARQALLQRIDAAKARSDTTLQRAGETPLGIPQSPRRGRGGIRIGVVPLRSFTPGEGEDVAALLTYEISAALSKFRWISVPTPDAVAASLGPSRDMPAACESLGLDFLLDGQLQVQPGRLRFRASLISTEESAIVWSFKTDRDDSDQLTLQDEIAAEIAARIDSHILTTESQRVDSSLLQPHDAYGLVMRAVRIACSLDPSTFAEPIDLLARAIALEPNRPMARISTALYFLIAASQGWLLAPAAALQRAEAEAQAALQMDPSEAQAWAIQGFVRAALYQQPEDAAELLARAITINPNLPLAWHFSTGNCLFLGDLTRAGFCISRYERLGPTGVHFFGNSALITLRLLEGRNEDAVRIGRTTMAMHPNFVAAQKPLVAALGQLGLKSEAAAAFRRLRTLEPGFEIETFLRSSPFRRSEDRERYAAGLRWAERAAGEGS